MHGHRRMDCHQQTDLVNSGGGLSPCGEHSHDNARPQALQQLYCPDQRWHAQSSSEFIILCQNPSCLASLHCLMLHMHRSAILMYLLSSKSNTRELLSLLLILMRPAAMQSTPRWALPVRFGRNIQYVMHLLVMLPGIKPSACHQLMPAAARNSAPR